MSWKSVEMQVALPRTQDAGQLQDQLSKQNQRFQESLTQHQLREDLLKRRQVKEFEKTTGKKIKDEESNQARQQSQEEDQEQSDRDQESNRRLSHPYLGQHIDFSR